VRSIVFRAVIGTLGLLGLLGSTSLSVVAAPVNSPASSTAIRSLT